MNKEVVYRIGCEDVAEGEEDVSNALDIIEELREQGYENPEELLEKLKIGLEQCRCGKGISTEELKKKLKKINEKYKKTLTNLK